MGPEGLARAVAVLSIGIAIKTTLIKGSSPQLGAASNDIQRVLQAESNKQRVGEVERGQHKDGASKMDRSGQRMRDHEQMGSWSKEKHGDEREQAKENLKAKDDSQNLNNFAHNRHGWKNVYHKEEYANHHKFHDVAKNLGWNHKRGKFNNDYESDKGQKFNKSEMNNFYDKDKHGTKYDFQRGNQWKKSDEDQYDDDDDSVSDNSSYESEDLRGNKIRFVKSPSSEAPIHVITSTNQTRTKNPANSTRNRGRKSKYDLQESGSHSSLAPNATRAHRGKKRPRLNRVEESVPLRRKKPRPFSMEEGAEKVIHLVEEPVSIARNYSYIYPLNEAMSMEHLLTHTRRDPSEMNLGESYHPMTLHDQVYPSMLPQHTLLSKGQLVFGADNQSEAIRPHSNVLDWQPNVTFEASASDQVAHFGPRLAMAGNEVGFSDLPFELDNDVSGLESQYGPVDETGLSHHQEPLPPTASEPQFDRQFGLFARLPKEQRLANLLKTIDYANMLANPTMSDSSPSPVGLLSPTIVQQAFSKLLFVRIPRILSQNLDRHRLKVQQQQQQMSQEPRLTTAYSEWRPHQRPPENIELIPPEAELQRDPNHPYEMSDLISSPSSSPITIASESGLPASTGAVTMQPVRFETYQLPPQYMADPSSFPPNCTTSQAMISPMMLTPAMSHQSSIISDSKVETKLPGGEGFVESEKSKSSSGKQRRNHKLNRSNNHHTGKNKLSQRKTRGVKQSNRALTLPTASSKTSDVHHHAASTLLQAKWLPSRMSTVADQQHLQSSLNLMDHHNQQPYSRPANLVWQPQQQSKQQQQDSLGWFNISRARGAISHLLIDSGENSNNKAVRVGGNKRPKHYEQHRPEYGQQSPVNLVVPYQPSSDKMISKTTSHATRAAANRHSSHKAAPNSFMFGQKIIDNFKIRLNNVDS